MTVRWRKAAALVAGLMFSLSAIAETTVPPKPRGMKEGFGRGGEIDLSDGPLKEDAVTLPPFPVDARLVEFRPRGASKNRFYVDEPSISIGADWVVRYTVVVKSPSGASNVSYEALRCKTGEYKIYAWGTRDGSWTAARDPKWQPVGASTTNLRFSIWADYFCDAEAVAGKGVKELVANLKGRSLTHYDRKDPTAGR